RAGVKRLIYNTAAYVPLPGQSCGEPRHDQTLTIENAFADRSYGFNSFRPTIFMENLLTAFHKPALVQHSEYRYCHAARLKSDWICHADLARYMVAALEAESTIGRRYSVGGPETLTTSEIVRILEAAMGKPLTLNVLTPRQYAPYLYEIIRPAA